MHTHVRPFYPVLLLGAIILAATSPVLCGAPVVAAGIPLSDVPARRLAPDYKITVPDGRPLSVSMFRGKVLVVDIMATHCKRCLAFTNVLVKVFEDYRPRDLQILAAAINPVSDNEAAVKEYIAMHRVFYPLGLAPLDSVYDFLGFPKDPNLIYSPNLVIIDREGRVRVQLDGHDPFFQDTETNLRTLLDRLIAEKDPSAEPQTH